MTNRKMKQKPLQRGEPENTGKLKIGDSWNAITIIALSQTNPIKAIAEFVENSIDASAKNITIIRGKEQGEYFLKVIDDGTGIPLNEEGIPDFKYVATHICDSIKKQLKKKGVEGIQGEFGIGLLSFWTVGERLTLTCAGKDEKTYQMEMKRNEPCYTINKKRTLFSHPGTELIIHPLLPGIRQLTGEKIQNYLASELRDRIRKAKVMIKIKDRTSRKEFHVEPREYTGRFLHDIEPMETWLGEIYCELYLNTFDPHNEVSLFRHGTRVLPNIASIDQCNKEPWSSGYLQGMLDVPFLTITPGTRDGIIQDEPFALFLKAMEPVEVKLLQIIEQEKKAEEEKASKDILRSVKRAFKEAFIALSSELYSWLDIYAEGNVKKKKPSNDAAIIQQASGDETGVPMKTEEFELANEEELKFFEYAGPLYKVVISPSSAVVKVKTEKKFRVIPRDRNKRIVEHGLYILWEIKEGTGVLEDTDKEIVSFTAPSEPGIVILKVTVLQGDTICTAEGIATITDTLAEKDDKKESAMQKGLPSYTFKRAPGELWRSYYDIKNNIIVINNGHADYIFAAKKSARKLKYICKLYAKELVLHNFVGYNSEKLLERIVELSLYTEEHLK
jgi:hypothetical protein